MDGKNLYWGDFHKHLQDIKTADQLVESARGHLEIYPVPCYPFVWFEQTESGDRKLLGQPSDLHRVFSDWQGDGRVPVGSTVVFRIMKSGGVGKNRSRGVPRPRKVRILARIGVAWGSAEIRGPQRNLFRLRGRPGTWSCLEGAAIGIINKF